MKKRIPIDDVLYGGPLDGKATALADGRRAIYVEERYPSSAAPGIEEHCYYRSTSGGCVRYYWHALDLSWRELEAWRNRGRRS